MNCFYINLAFAKSRDLDFHSNPLNKYYQYTSNLFIDEVF